MNILVKNDYEELCEYVANEIAIYINTNKNPLICLAAGDTMLGVFKRLVALQDKGIVNLNNSFYVELDEWVGLDYSVKGSCKQVMYDNFYLPAKINPAAIKTFNGKSSDLQGECIKIKNYIAERGGIGLSVLGIGLNGHIGFNEPNCKCEDDCIVVPLDDVTKTVCHKYFGSNIPVKQGITIGLKALSRSKRIMLIANGEHKASVVLKTAVHPVSFLVPSTILREHNNIQLVIDKSAAGQL